MWDRDQNGSLYIMSNLHTATYVGTYTGPILGIVSVQISVPVPVPFPHKFCLKALFTCEVYIGICVEIFFFGVCERETQFFKIVRYLKLKFHKPLYIFHLGKMVSKPLTKAALKAVPQSAIMTSVFTVAQASTATPSTARNAATPVLTSSTPKSVTTTPVLPSNLPQVVAIHVPTTTVATAGVSMATRPVSAATLTTTMTNNKTLTTTPIPIASKPLTAQQLGVHTQQVRNCVIATRQVVLVLVDWILKACLLVPSVSVTVKVYHCVKRTVSIGTMLTFPNCLGGAQTPHSGILLGFKRWWPIGATDRQIWLARIKLWQPR